MSPRVTQEWVAEKVGVTRITYVGWEKSAEFRVSLHEAEKLAKILKVPMSSLQNLPDPAKELPVVQESIDIYKALKRLEQQETEIIKGKDELIAAKEGEINRLQKDSLFYQETIRNLTQGLSALKKV